MLEECGLEHRAILMRLTEGDQFKPEFLKISPNAKMPAILDHDNAGDPVSVFESGAILVYLAEKAGRFMPTDPLGRRETLEWLFWQAGNQGPMAGQLSHFVNYAPEGEAYGRKRYAGEYDRNLGVLERRLRGRQYILNDYSIADMMAFPWVFIAKPLGASLDAFPNLAAWRERIKNREAVKRAIDLFKDRQNRGKQNASNNNILFNQGAAHILTIGD
jgi:GST-like protein